MAEDAASPTAAAPAAVKIAAQVAIVSGFDAVAPSAVANALRGELTYWVGARLGRAHCALCAITHGLVRERRDWKALKAEQGGRCPGP